MVREHYVLFWGIFFAITSVGSVCVIFALGLIARQIGELKEALEKFRLKPKLSQ